MHGIVYVSQAAVPFDQAALKELAEFAAKRNAELEVTGYLSFNDGRFMQYIEGPTPEVTDLMARIAQDRRHKVLHQTSDDRVIERRFPTWRMRWIRHADFIGLEHVLGDYLALLSSIGQSPEKFQPTVWKMVDRIAELRASAALV